MTQKTTAAEFDQRIEAANVHLDAEIEALQKKKAALRDLVEHRRRYADQLAATLARLQSEQEAMDAEVRRLLTEEEQAVVFPSLSAAR